MSQHVYFAVASQTLTADAITAELGIEPDRISVLGSRQMAPRPIPAAHRWEVHSPDRVQPIDVQAAAVLDRIAPAAGAVRRVVDRGAAAELVLVRYFNDENGTEENLEPVATPDGLRLEPIAGQHQLLGWCLGSEQLALLAAMRASIDADEYG